MNDYIAYLAEWGDNGLDFTPPGRRSDQSGPVSTHFIVTAITLRKEQLHEAESQVEAVRQRFFQTGAIESASVGSDDKLRRSILEQLLTVPFQIFALVVDKRELRGEGFYHKSSFYKFLHGLADRELYRSFPNLELVAGRHGDERFMQGFVQYVHDRHVPTLFNQASFRFVNSQASVLVQTADFVAGTLARCYDETVLSPERTSFVQLLRPKLLTLKYWPDVFTPVVAQSIPEQTNYNAGLAELCVGLGQDFLHRKLASRSPQEVDQVTCLQYLLFHFRHVDPSRYISSRELMAHMGERRGNSPTLHYFQTRVIAPLRDAGVIIASSTKGYKIPSCESDLYDFINHSNTIIQPLLSRIRKCRERIRLATGGAIDLLDREEYANLNQLLTDPPLTELDTGK
ncbi:DUF3800 domain-containing protein [Spirosoma agri]|uniref:DUF3800 domain-containing protein n=1 Tax=Spirosoma agri TaxID=1987381 RepID=A0A6M0IS51_9BACT|nr:DUF3800 domain-containing protein [Spirosoma agri]NEU70842.1 DUF3800 domain-containing protein [Spirosoma agri]